MENFVAYLILPALFLATIAFIVVAAWRFHLIRKEEKLLKDQENYLKQERKFSESEQRKRFFLEEVYPFPLKFLQPIDNEGYQRQIYALPKSSDGSSLLHLTWETFGKGIVSLCEQIEQYLESQKIDSMDICIGINETGVIISNFINFKCFKRKSNLGYIFYQDDNEYLIKEEPYLPKLTRKKTKILVADFELKKGEGLKQSIDIILNKYNNNDSENNLEIEIFFAVFGAEVNIHNSERKDSKIKDISELAASQKLKPYIDNKTIYDIFIACTMYPPGIEPPLALK